MASLTVATTPPPPEGPLHERIKSARGFARLTQDALLDRMRSIDPDLTPTRRTYSKWENGDEVGVHELVAIAKATGFPVVWFVMDLDHPGHHPDDPGGLEFRDRGCNGAQVLDFRARAVRAPASAVVAA